MTENDRVPYHDYVSKLLPCIPPTIPSVMLTYERTNDMYKLTGVESQKYSFKMTQSDITDLFKCAPLVRLPYMLRPFDGVRTLNSQQM